MEGAHTTARGCLLQDVGELDLALAHHAEAARIFHELGSRYREASALYYLATTYVERGEHDEALAVLRQSQARSEGVGAPRYEALIAGGTALALAALGRDHEANDALARAEAAVARVPDEPSLAATLAAHRLTLDVHAGRRALSDAVLRIEARILATPSDDTRFALRALRRVGGRARPPEALVVWGAGEAFQPPRAERVDLPSRSPLRRILDRLVAVRLETPGEVLSIDEVIRAGWPEEKIGADAALNRAYVALATLRKRGLRDVLVSTDGGYALSQSIVVRRAQ
jgi:tetratricopeptide (TPR) repeat protein